MTNQTVGFDAFVGPRRQDMWVLATRLAGPQAREDVLQEALLTAWRRFSSYDPACGSTRTWLLLLVADRCRKHWRSDRPTSELVDLATPAVDVDGQVDLSTAVAGLLRRQRLAVELYYVLGLPVAECAVVMNCAVGTLSSTLSDARRSLRSTLEMSG